MKERRASSSEVGPCHARREAGICITLVLSAMYDTSTGSIHAGAAYRQPAEQGTECIFRQNENEIFINQADFVKKLKVHEFMKLVHKIS